MPNITDYAYLIQNMFGESKTSRYGLISVSNLGSKSVQNQLRAAGIDTSSPQYKKVISDITAASNGVGYVNIQGIKNRMRNYDSDGDWIDPTTGLSGLVVTDKNRASKNKIISIPDSIKEEMFEQAKKEFLQDNGVGVGENTRRSEIYTKLYKQTAKKNRLAAGHTLSQYEKQYYQAFEDAVKSIDVTWKPGKAIPKDALDNVTRKNVESLLIKSGGNLVKRNINISI